MKKIIVFILMITAAGVSFGAGKTKTSQEYKLREFSVKIESIFTEFLQRTLVGRLGYFYAGEFVSENLKKQTKQAADEASAQLDQLLDQYRAILKDIEEYDGDDWDLKYGSTGLWEKVNGDIEKANVAQIESLIWSVRANGMTREMKIGKVLEQWHKLKLGNVGFKNLLLGKIVSLEDKAKALTVYEAIDANRMEDNLRAQLVVEESDLKLKMDKSIDVKALAWILNSGASEENKISAAFLLSRSGVDGVIEKVVNKIQPSRGLVAGICYEYLSNNFEKAQAKFGKFELQLTAQEMFSRGCDGVVPELMEKIISSQKFAFGDFYYISAICSKDVKPARAVDLFVLAANSKNSYGYYERKVAAYEAAVLGYELFRKDKSYAAMAMEGFECLRAHDKEAFNDQMEFLYSKVLKYSGDDQRYNEQMSNIAKGKSEYSIYARYELLLTELEGVSPEDANLPENVLDEIEGLIKDSTEKGMKEVANKTAALWGQFAVGANDSNIAERYLDITDKYEISQESLFYRARAKAILGDVEGAVNFCYRAVDENKNIEEYFYDIYKVISLSAEKIDDPLLRERGGFTDLIGKIDRIGNVCLKYGRNDAVTNAITASWLECVAYSGKWTVEMDQLWNNISQGDQKETLAFIRCGARVDFVKGDFAKAAENWTTISKYYRNRETETGAIDKWWRAKYYQILCLWKDGSADQGLKHHIEVLLNSHTDQDNLWKDKIAQIYAEI